MSSSRSHMASPARSSVEAVLAFRHVVTHSDEETLREAEILVEKLRLRSNAAAVQEIVNLSAFLMERFPNEVVDGGAVEVAIRLLRERRFRTSIKGGRYEA